MIAPRTPAKEAIRISRRPAGELHRFLQKAQAELFMVHSQRRSEPASALLKPARDIGKEHPCFDIRQLPPPPAKYSRILRQLQSQQQKDHTVKDNRIAQYCPSQTRHGAAMAAGERGDGIHPGGNCGRCLRRQYARQSGGDAKGQR